MPLTSPAPRPRFSVPLMCFQFMFHGPYDHILISLTYYVTVFLLTMNCRK